MSGKKKVVRKDVGKKRKVKDRKETAVSGENERVRVCPPDATQIRQGDVLLVRQPAKALEGMKKQGKTSKQPHIVARGEATGHHHQLGGGTCFADEEDNRIYALEQPEELTHQEHDTITSIPVDNWGYEPQREFDPAMIRKVVD